MRKSKFSEAQIFKILEETSFDFQKDITLTRINLSASYYDLIINQDEPQRYLL